MPRVRSTRTRSSTSVVSDVSSISQGELATVPPLKDAILRLKWACELRGKSPSSFISTLSTGSSSGKPHPRLWCRLCNERIQGDQKTMDRHQTTDGHLMSVARELRVDFKSLRATPMLCKYCKKGIAGGRKDSLKRHEEKCRNNPACRALGSTRATSMPDLNEAPARKSTGKRLERSISMPTSLPSHPSSSRVAPPTSNAHSSASDSRAATPAPPAMTLSTTSFYGLSAPHTSHAPLLPPSIDADVLLSALRQPILTIRHTEYELLPPPYFGTDPLFCLGPAAVGFDSDLETLSGGPPGWDWLIEEPLA